MNKFHIGASAAPSTPLLRPAGLLLALLLLTSACGSSESGESTAPSETAASETSADSTSSDEDDHDVENHEQDDADADNDSTDTDASVRAVDIGLFFDGAIDGDITTEDCTLSGGTETTCYRITVAGFPASHDVGPFCPTTINDGADAGGIWFDGTGVYDLSGEFFVNLAELYGDDNWLMYDEDGNILVTETAEEFDAAARPDVDPSLQNHCVEGALEWLENGEPIPTTVVIPTTPVFADGSTASQGNNGVTLDGIVIAASAPVDAILSAYTIAAFDDCGAHFNPFEGYHMHGAVGCSEIGDAVDGETPMFGYAMDGFPIHSPLDEADVAAADLDECNGHTTDETGYHYHANNAAQNQVIECLVGETVAGEEAGRGGPPADGERPEPAE